MKLYTIDPKKRRKVLAGDLSLRVFHKTVKPNHYIWTRKGYGIQEEVISQLEGQCDFIEIMSPVKKYVFRFTQYKDSYPTDLGHGLQRIVPINQAIEARDKLQYQLFV